MPDEEKHPVWRGIFEGAVVFLVVLAIGAACYWGCGRKSKTPTNTVKCPACGAMLELKESQK